jgi:uncharacterized protein (DUF1330 family)
LSAIALEFVCHLYLIFTIMSAYAVGHISKLSICRDVVTYLRRIDETLKPFSGRFLVHGAEPEVLEGSFEGQLIIIEFPDLEHARSWYHSPAYQEIVSLRTNHAESNIIIVDSVSAGHQATDTLRHDPP